MLFLQHSLWLPKLLYKMNAPFIAPLIPWELTLMAPMVTIVILRNFPLAAQFFGRNFLNLCTFF